MELSTRERVTLLFALWSAAERSQARAHLMPQWGEEARQEAAYALALLTRVELALYGQTSSLSRGRTAAIRRAR